MTIDFIAGRLETLDPAEGVAGPNARARNPCEQPGSVRRHPFKAVQVHDGRAAVELPPLSIAALTFKLASL